MVSGRMLRSIGVGAIAYGVGFLLTGAAVTVGGGPAWRSLQAEIGSTGAAGWAFYSAHVVGVSEGSPAFLEGSVRLFNELVPDIPVVAFYLIPVVVLLIAGALNAVADAEFEPTDRTGAAHTGARIANGYAVLAVLGAMVLVYDEPGVVSGTDVGPDIGATLILMGFVFPMALGGLGGVLATWLARRHQGST